MEKILETISSFASAQEHGALLDRTTDIEKDIKSIRTAYYDYTLAHNKRHIKEAEQVAEQLKDMQNVLHRIRTTLVWLIVGLTCSGVTAILALCIHLIS